MNKIIASVFVLLFLFSPAASVAQGKIEHPRFMKEYSAYIIDRLDREAEIRGLLRKFIDGHRAKLTEGFGMHPEFLPEMFRLAGAERINCMSGKYYEKFLVELNNEERHTFYDTTQMFSWWVVCLAVEEADAMNVKKLGPPISFRQKGDTPYYIKQDLKADLASYAKESSGRSGLSFSNMSCHE